MTFLTGSSNSNIITFEISSTKLAGKKGDVFSSNFETTSFSNTMKSGRKLEVPFILSSMACDGEIPDCAPLDSSAET